MVNKLAIDWDENELRLVAAQCSGRSVKVTGAHVIPVDGSNIQEFLRQAVAEHGLEDTDTLVAIGRGKAELRELQLPPVPDEELPDMVRFQAIRSFATAGESATVDYLVTKRNESGVEMIAAAVGPSNLASIQETGEKVGLPIKRIALRPLAAAALYLVNHPEQESGDTVLIDLLSDDAEIVVTRERHVIFVRTVRMPSAQAARARALAGELRRSLLACGSSGAIGRVILWGRESVHVDELQVLAEAAGCEVQVINPFDLVEVDRKVSLPDHVGRLAPLVGLLVADDAEPDRLIDFLNPRQRQIETVSPYRKAALIGVPVAAALLLAFGVYRRIKSLDQEIASLRAANAAMQPEVDRARESIAKTETVDEFLDGDVNWLQEIRRMAVEMPPADQMIVRSVSVSSNPRGGGGTLKVEGGAVNPSVIDEFERAVRDESHRVKGGGASEQRTEDAYRWGFTESISVTGDSVRNQRYAAITDLIGAGSSTETPAATEAAASPEPVNEDGPPGNEATVNETTVVDETTVEEAVAAADADRVESDNGQAESEPSSQPAGEALPAASPETESPPVEDDVDRDAADADAGETRDANQESPEAPAALEVQP